MKHNRGRAWIIAGLAGVLIVAGLAIAGDAVAPQTAALTCYRSAVGASISGTFYKGTTLLFTNCVAYSDATGGVVQALADVDIEVRLGSTSTSIAYAATVDVASNGTFYVSTTVPTNIPSVVVQVKLTDENTNTFIYPPYTLLMREPLD